METIQRGGVESVRGAIASLHAALPGERADFHEAVLSLIEQSDKCVSPSRTRQEILRHALGMQDGFDLDAAGSNGKRVLDLAVEKDDQDFARHLLERGADPAQVRAPSTAGMRSLLTSFRWMDRLYPPAGRQDDGQRWSDLDQALIAGRRDQAKALMDDRLGGRDLCTAWRDAVQNNERDLLRAVLILSGPNDLTSLTNRSWEDKPQYQSALQQALTLGDTGLSAVIKEFPYQSPARERIDRLNGVAEFAESSAPIVCRSLATHHLEQQASHPQNKFDWDQFASAAQLSKHVHLDTEKTFETLKTHAAETHLVSNAKLGKLLADQFTAMEKDNASSKFMLLTSVNHAMNLVMRIKDKDIKKSFVVKFYDPNYTTNLTRVKSDSLQTFEGQTIKSYVHDGDMDDYYQQAYTFAEFELDEINDGWLSDAIDAYLDKAKGASMVFVRPDNGVQPGAAGSSGAEKKLTTCLQAEDMGPDAVTLLMENGYADDLLSLRTHLPSLPEELQVRLLGIQDTHGHSPLYAAMEKDQAETIRAFGELLEMVPKHRRFEILLAKSSDDWEEPALLNVASRGKHESVKAYREVLESLFGGDSSSRPQKRQRLDQGGPPEPEIQELVDLIAAKNNSGMPALYSAMDYGCAKSVKEFGEMLKLVPPDRQCELLLAFDDRNVSGLHRALGRKHWDAVMQYLDIVNTLAPGMPADDVAALRKELAECRSSLVLMGMPNASKFQETFRKFEVVSRALDALAGQAGGATSSKRY